MMQKRFKRVVEYKNVDGYTNLIWQFALVIWAAFIIFLFSFPIGVGFILYILGVAHGRLSTEYKSPIRDVYYEEVK